MRSAHDSPTKNCTKDDCGKPLRARGLCATHYNQTLPNRHLKKLMVCDGCDREYLKSVRGHDRATNYCSELCRQWKMYGPWSSKLPASHWVFMINRTCAFNCGRLFECGWCGKTAHSFKRARFCSDKCHRTASHRRRRAREYNAIGTYTWAEITRLWIQFDRCCAYCSTPTPLADIQAEHVQPLSRGGANNLTNLLPSCGACNSDKRDLLLHEWAADRARRHLPTVNTTWRAADSRYKHLTYRTKLRLSA